MLNNKKQQKNLFSFRNETGISFGIMGKFSATF